MSGWHLPACSSLEYLKPMKVHEYSHTPDIAFRRLDTSALHSDSEVAEMVVCVGEIC